jgi:NAD(P)-dependent dehydrogenase (short-subunit alcohol dehydrogenase family)
MYLEKLRMTGKTAIVAGGGAGMGLAIAHALAEAGAKVAIIDLDKARAERAAREIAAKGAPVMTLAANVTHPRDVERIVSEVTTRWGGFDSMTTVIGGQQGIAPWVNAGETKEEDWDKVVNLNLTHAFLLAKAAINHYVKRNAPGSFLSVSSVNGLLSAPRHSAYGAAKAGLISLTRTLALEYGDKGIRVNSIAPGTIMTERSAPGYSERDVTRLNGIVPLGRIGKTEEIASVALFLLSDLASYITGQTIVVDGGMMSTYPFALQKPE